MLWTLLQWVGRVAFVAFHSLSNVTSPNSMLLLMCILISSCLQMLIHQLSSCCCCCCFLWSVDPRSKSVRGLLLLSGVCARQPIRGHGGPAQALRAAAGAAECVAQPPLPGGEGGAGSVGHDEALSQGHRPLPKNTRLVVAPGCVCNVLALYL